MTIFSRQAALTTPSFDKKFVPGYNLGRVSAGRHIPGFGALMFSHLFVAENELGGNREPKRGKNRLNCRNEISSDGEHRTVVHWESVCRNIPLEPGYVFSAGMKRTRVPVVCFYTRHPPSYHDHDPRPQTPDPGPQTQDPTTPRSRPRRTAARRVSLIRDAGARSQKEDLLRSNIRSSH